MKAVVATFNQEKALVGAFSVITNLRMELFEALAATHCSWLATNELWTTAVAEWRVREVLGRRGDTAACAGIIIERLYIYTSDCQTVVDCGWRSDRGLTEHIRIQMKLSGGPVTIKIKRSGNILFEPKTLIPVTFPPLMKLVSKK